MSNLLDGKKEWLLVGGITLLALILRVWQLDGMPPGWRDDELINLLVISQKVLDGQWAVYFPDASGHEGLYHTLAAGMVALFGWTAVGMRGLSVILGTMTIPLTYLLGRKLFNNRLVGLTAGLGLAFSFWSLMYSRIGLRHISVVVFTLLGFYFFWRGLKKGDHAKAQRRKEEGRVGHLFRVMARSVDFGLAGVFLGVNFYTYFASRGVPLILLAFVVYLALFRRPLFRGKWRGMVVTGVLTAVLALPLFVTLSRQPESEARVAELAVPLVEARAGNFEPLGDHIVRTLSMFHNDGDDEWLYNIPFRPVFGPVGAIFFWAGVVIAVWKTIAQIIKRGNTDGDPAYPFLLMWWLAGIAPGFVSVPAASLGHTIIAQPAVYLLASLPVGVVYNQYRSRRESARVNGRFTETILASRWLAVGLAVLLVGTIAVRDTAAYFNEWPSRGLTRFLYRADIKDLAHYLESHPQLTDFGVTSLLAGPWDQEAFRIEVGGETVYHPRWYNPERAILLSVSGERPLSFSGYPDVPVLYPDWYQAQAGQTAGGYQLSLIDGPLSDNTADDVCFENGLCLLAADYNRPGQILDLVWRAERPLSLPEAQLISNPPPPGVYAGPRLFVFGQLLDASDNFLAGDDGLWVDPYSLQRGDVFLQQHRPFLAEGQEAAYIVVGLYDPMTNERILTVDGRDHVKIAIE